MCSGGSLILEHSVVQSDSKQFITLHKTRGCNPDFSNVAAAAAATQELTSLLSVLKNFH